MKDKEYIPPKKQMAMGKGKPKGMAKGGKPKC